MNSYYTTCPRCSSNLHYSSCFDDIYCLYCQWATGDSYKQLPKLKLQIEDWMTTCSLLIQQRKMNNLSYDEFINIIENEMALI